MDPLLPSPLKEVTDKLRSGFTDLHLDPNAPTNDSDLRQFFPGPLVYQTRKDLFEGREVLRSPWVSWTVENPPNTRVSGGPDEV